MARTVKCEAAPKDVQVITESDSWMHLPALNVKVRLRCPLDSRPDKSIIFNFCDTDLLYGLWVITSHQESFVSTGCQRAALPRHRYVVSLLRLLMYLNPKPFSLLHPLNERLNTACQLHGKLIPRNRVVRFCDEALLICIVIFWFHKVESKFGSFIQSPRHYILFKNKWTQFNWRFMKGGL